MSATVHDNGRKVKADLYEIRATAATPAGAEPDGYIVWIPPQPLENTRSLLAIINRNSWLPFRCTLVGFTKKSQVVVSAGKHGEGLKAASSVLMRNHCGFSIFQ